MSEPNDKREGLELPLHLKHLEYGAINRMMSPPDLVLSLINEHKAALSANREKDAEIERLKGILAGQDGAMEENVRLRGQLASLRASGGGEKWIDVDQEMPKHHDMVLVWLEGDDCASYVGQAFWARHEGWGWTRGDGFSANDVFRHVTHWQPLPDPPSLPTEKE